jgi:hypothetical protein
MAASSDDSTFFLILEAVVGNPTITQITK